MIQLKRKQQRHVVTGFFLLICSGALAQENKSDTRFESYTDSAEIEVVLKGAAAGIVKLLGYYGDGNLERDSSIADSSGKVVFRNPKHFDEGMYYAVYSDNSFIAFLLGHNQKIFLHTDRMDIAKNMKTNSAENKLYCENQIYESNFAARIDSAKNKMTAAAVGSKLYSAHKKEVDNLVSEKEEVVKGYVKKYPGSFFAKFKMLGQNPRLHEMKKPNGDIDTMAQTIAHRNEYWNNYDFSDMRLLRTPVYFNKLKKYLTTLFYQRGDSMLSGVKFILDKVDKGDKEVFSFTVNYLLLTYHEPPVMGGEIIFCYTVDNYFTREKAFWSDSVNIYRTQRQSDMMRPSMLGETGQDVNCKNEKGEYVNLYSIKKPIRVVYLFNPDCEHCQKETPKLKKLYDKWKSKGLEVYAIIVAGEYDKWHKYINDLHLDWVNVIDPKYESGYHKKYYVSITPGLYVLDAKNKIVAKQAMPDSLEEIFERMVGGKN